MNVNDINAIIDGDLKTRWHAREQRGAEMVTIDLGVAHTLRALVLCLGSYTSQYPRVLAVDASDDGRDGWRSGRVVPRSSRTTARSQIPLRCRWPCR